MLCCVALFVFSVSVVSAGSQTLLDELSTGRFVSRSADGYVPSTERARARYANASLSECWRNTSVYMAGTSYHRSVFWSVVKDLNRGKLPDELLMIGSGEGFIREIPENETKCDPRVGNETYHALPIPFNLPIRGCVLARDPSCNEVGPAGIDVKRCGMPQHGSFLSENGTRVMYQFKTYFEASAVDRLIFSQIASRWWDVVWVQAGEWGSYGRKKAPLQESIDFLSGVARAHARDGRAVVVSGAGPKNRPFLRAARMLGDRFLVFDQRKIVKAAERVRMAEKHGHYGEITRTFARVVAAALCRSDGDDGFADALRIRVTG